MPQVRLDRRVTAHILVLSKGVLVSELHSISLKTVSSTVLSVRIEFSELKQNWIRSDITDFETKTQVPVIFLIVFYPLTGFSPLFRRYKPIEGFASLGGKATFEWKNGRLRTARNLWVSA